MIHFRPYQEEFIEKTLAATLEYDRILSVCATGGGKTLLLSEIIRRWSAFGNCLFLADAKELVYQTMDKYEMVTGVRPAMEQGDSKAQLGDRVIVATTQSLARRLDKYPKDYFGLICVDEAHKNTLGAQAQKVLTHFNAVVIGVTATPFRSDKQELGKFYDTIPVNIGLKRLIDEGFLSRISVKQIPLGISLKGVRTVAGDYTAEDLGQAIEPHLEKAVDAILEHAPTRKTVVFLPLIETSKMFCEIACRKGLRAVHVDGTDREALRTDWQVISNASLLTTGWDEPSVDCVMILRPTKSNVLYCLDERTEILTSEGWKRDVEVGEKVAAFDSKTGLIKYVPALAKIRRELNENEHFCSILTNSADIRVTNKHRMLYDNKRRKGWKFKTADQISNLKDGCYLPISGILENIQEIPLTDDEIKFIGWVMTDGHINRTTKAIQISQGEHQPWINEIENCIIGCGFKYSKYISEYNSQFNANSKRVTWVISRGKPRGRDKHLTGWGRLEPYLTKEISPLLMNMSVRQFEILLEVIHLADGHKQNTEEWTQRSYHISKGNQEFAENLQILAITHGYRSSLHRSYQNKNTLYTVHIKKADRICIGSKQDSRPTWKKEPYKKETVWCVENELGTLITRRRGKVAIVGNCQMTGRGTRLFPGKTDLLLIDPLFLASEHSLVRPARLFAESKEEEEAIQKNIDEGVGDLDEAAEKGKADRHKALIEAATKARQRKSKSCDVFDLALSLEADHLADYEPETIRDAEPISEKQKAFLEKRGIDIEQIKCKGHATKWIDLLIQRQALDLASPKQVKWLQKFGYNQPHLAKFKQASEFLDKRFNKSA